VLNYPKTGLPFFQDPSDPGVKNGKKSGKKAEKGLHFPEIMIYYLFITLRNRGFPLQFHS